MRNRNRGRLITIGVGGGSCVTGHLHYFCNNIIYYFTAVVVVTVDNNDAVTCCRSFRTGDDFVVVAI